ncbi:MAG: chloride channel protein [Thermoguttaceae bacterium]
MAQPVGRWTWLFSLAALTGLAGGLAAAAMEWGLAEGSRLLVARVVPQASDQILHFSWGVLLLPALGGLISAVAILLLCPRSLGHGTTVLTRAFHRNQGELELRGPSVKAAAAVAVIACGGSAGPEGPIAAWGAALGSTCGRLFRVSPRQRRILLLAGCAAGIGAIFRCPLGGALFAVSIPYSEPDYESEAIAPSLIASVMGYSVFMALWGHGVPLLRHAQNLAFDSPWELLAYAVLGPLCGLVAIVLGMSFRGVEAAVTRARRLPGWLMPVLGGLATGAVACLLPQVMDGRYDFIQLALDGGIFAAGTASWAWWAGLFGAVTVAKCVATSLTVGSGGSGGVLGPSLFIGGGVGAFLGAAIEAVWPGVFPETLRQALIPVGMGGVLAASMRTPLAAIVMVAEMTASYGLIVPLMVVCVSAYVVGRRWGLNPEQVPTAAESPVHSADALVHFLESSSADELLDRDWKQVVTPTAGLGEILHKIEPGQQPTFAVVDANGWLLGIINLPDLDRVISNAMLSQVVIAHDLMTPARTVLHPDDDLYYALEMFRRENGNVLPVVAREQPQRWLGMLARRRVFDAVMRQAEASREFIAREYAGLLAIDQEARLENLLTTLAPTPTARIKRLMVPLELLGKSIRQSQFRSRYGGQIIAIEDSDGSLQCPPDLDRPLESQQRLLALVEEKT